MPIVHPPIHPESSPLRQKRATPPFDSVEKTPVVRKRRRSSSLKEPLERMIKYLEKSEELFEKMEQTVSRLAVMSAERNIILSKLAEALVRK